MIPVCCANDSDSNGLVKTMEMDSSLVSDDVEMDSGKKHGHVLLLTTYNSNNNDHKEKDKLDFLPGLPDTDIRDVAMLVEHMSTTLQSMDKHIHSLAETDIAHLSFGPPEQSCAFFQDKEIFDSDLTIAQYVISKAVCNKAVLANYVNLSMLLHKFEDTQATYQQVSVVSGSLKISSPAPSVDSYNKWLEAMLNYEHLLLNHTADIQMYGKLLAYRRYIHILQRKFKWEAVYQYDKKFRIDLASKRTFDFHVPNVKLFMEVFDATSLKNDKNPSDKQCFRCKSDNHLVGLCPFQAETQVAPQAASGGKEEVPPTTTATIMCITILATWGDQYTKKKPPRGECFSTNRFTIVAAICCWCLSASASFPSASTPQPPGARVGFAHSL